MIAGLVRDAPGIARKAARATGCAYLADELEGAALEGLERACRKFDPVKHQTSLPRPYCYQAMYYASIDAARNWMGRSDRAPKMAASMGEIVWDLHGDEWSDPMAEVDERMAITATLALLDEPRRAALLCYANGETQADVARRFGVSESRVNQWRRLALIRHTHNVRSSTERNWSTDS